MLIRKDRLQVNSLFLRNKILFRIFKVYLELLVDRFICSMADAWTKTICKINRIIIAPLIYNYFVWRGHIMKSVPTDLVHIISVHNISDLLKKLFQRKTNALGNGRSRNTSSISWSINKNVTPKYIQEA